MLHRAPQASLDAMAMSHHGSPMGFSLSSSLPSLWSRPQCTVIQDGTDWVLTWEWTNCGTLHAA